MTASNQALGAFSESSTPKIYKKTKDMILIGNNLIRNMTHFKITTTGENAHRKNQCGRSKAAPVIISLGREEFARMSRLLPEEREALEFFSHLDLTVRHIPSGPRTSPEMVEGMSLRSRLAVIQKSGSAL